MIGVIMAKLDISDEEWVQISKEMRSSDKPHGQWCEEFGVGYNTVLRNEKRLGLTEESSDQTEQVVFTQVQVSPNKQSSDINPLSVLVGDITINVSFGYSPLVLRSLIKDLRAL